MVHPKNLPSLDSPCVRNCCLDSKDICMGCGRHLEEILRWQSASNSEREAILTRALQRRALAKPGPNAR